MSFNPSQTATDKLNNIKAQLAAAGSDSDLWKRAWNHDHPWVVSLAAGQKVDELEKELAAAESAGIIDPLTAGLPGGAGGTLGAIGLPGGAGGALGAIGQPGGIIGDIIGVIGAPQNLLTKAIGLATGGIGAILTPVIGIIDNKVEILRALESTKNQFDCLVLSDCDGKPHGPLGSVFSDLEQNFMESFQKVYQKGLNELNRFVDRIDKFGDGLSDSSLIYYTNQLAHGPMGGFLESVGATSGFFAPVSDLIGQLGNATRSNSSTPVLKGIALNTTNDMFNKSPQFVQDLIVDATKVVTSVYNFNFESVVINDNTLPFIDKRNKERVQQEHARGKGVAGTANGNKLVKDVFFLTTSNKLVSGILTKVENLLGSKAFKLFGIYKTLNYFNEERNKSRSFDGCIDRLLRYVQLIFSESGDQVMQERCAAICTNLAGNVYNSQDRLNFTIKNNGIFRLNTVQGQVGSGTPPGETTSITGPGPNTGPGTTPIPNPITITPPSIISTGDTIPDSELCEDEEDCKDLNY